MRLRRAVVAVAVLAALVAGLNPAHGGLHGFRLIPPGGRPYANPAHIHLGAFPSPGHHPRGGSKRRPPYWWRVF